MTRPPPVPAAFPRWLLIVCIACLVLSPLAVVCFWHASHRLSGKTVIRELEARVRQRAEPLTLAELQARYPAIPDAENAAVSLMEVWEKEQPEYWAAFREGVRPLPNRRDVKFDTNLPYLGAGVRSVKRTESLSESNRVAAAFFLSGNAARMAAVRAALDRPRCRFPVQLTNGFSAVFPHLAEIKSEARRFQLEALITAERGEADACLASLAECVRLGNALADEPSLISQLVRIACLSMAIEGAEQLLSRQALSAAQLASARALFEDMKMSGALKTSLIAERAIDLSAFDMSPEALRELVMSGLSEPREAGDELGYNLVMKMMKASGIAAADRRLMLETMEEAIALAEQDTPESLRQFEELFQRLEQEARQFPPKIFSAMLLPALDNAAIRFARHEARRRAGLAALAVGQYRGAHDGQLPPQFEALVPEYLPAVPADPFDGQPLRFKPLTKGFVVYSIGQNRRDDGGTERSREAGSDECDETFIVER